MVARKFRRSRAFTLVELLVVLVIIGVLVALLVPAVGGAVRTAREASVSATIEQLSLALASFKLKHGRYPPSRLLCCEDGNYAPRRPELPGSPELQELARESARELRSIWPKLVLNTTRPDGVTWEIRPRPRAPGDPKSSFYDFDGDDEPREGPYVLEGYQCLVFFLGGIPSGAGVEGFATDPRNPFGAVRAPDGDGVTPPARNRAATLERSEPFFEFRADRLVDDGSGMPGLVDPLHDPDERRYLAYFRPHGRDYRTADNTVDGPAPHPYRTGDSASSPWHKPDSFQLISAGWDGLYGSGGAYDPERPDELSVPDRDNITNFSGGRLD